MILSSKPGLALCPWCGGVSGHEACDDLDGLHTQACGSVVLGRESEPLGASKTGQP